MADTPQQPDKEAGKKKRRRVVVAPPEGSDPHPDPEPERFTSDDNVERLKRDKPPHWG